MRNKLHELRLFDLSAILGSLGALEGYQSCNCADKLSRSNDSTPKSLTIEAFCTSRLGPEILKQASSESLESRRLNQPIVV